MRRGLLIATLAFSSCFNPKLEDGFPCGDEGECPDDFTCCDGYNCYRECPECTATDSCLYAALHTCDCTCLDCPFETACQLAKALDRDLAPVDCDSIVATDCSAPAWEESFENSNTCSDAYDGICDDGGPNSDSSICNYGTDCGDCGRR